MGFEVRRQAALVFGLFLACAELCRSVCFHRFPQTLLEWPFEMDAYLAGALLVAGALWAKRSPRGRALVAVGWGFVGGILYRSFFGQLADPERHGGAQGMILAFKALLFAGAILGMIGAARAPAEGEAAR